MQLSLQLYAVHNSCVKPTEWSNIQWVRNCLVLLSALALSLSLSLSLSVSLSFSVSPSPFLFLSLYVSLPPSLPLSLSLSLSLALSLSLFLSLSPLSLSLSLSLSLFLSCSLFHWFVIGFQPINDRHETDLWSIFQTANLFFLPVLDLDDLEKGENRNQWVFSISFSLHFF